MSLVEVRNALDYIASISSTKEKVALIHNFVRTNSEFKIVSELALNPFFSYNIRSIEPALIRTRKFDSQNVFDFLIKLSKKRGATDEDRKMLSRLSSIDPATVDVVNRILKKDLRCGAGVKLFREAIPELPIHEVQLCIDGTAAKKPVREKNRKKFYKAAGRASNACWSLKLNGVRVWCISILGKEKKYISRNGKEYKNFDCFDKEVERKHEQFLDNGMIGKNEVLILDGEVETTEGTFKSVMQQVRRVKDIDNSKFIFNIFDIAIPNVSLIHRYEMVKSIISDDSDKLKYVEHHTLTDGFDSIYKILDQVCEDGIEGIVVKVWNSHYEFKRANTWMKLKGFFSDEFPVIGWGFGEGKYKNTLGYLIVDVNGVGVKVGSGFPDSQRDDLMNNLPKLVEVRFKEYTDDGSLLHPSFICVRDDK